MHPPQALPAGWAADISRLLGAPTTAAAAAVQDAAAQQQPNPNGLLVASTASANPSAAGGVVINQGAKVWQPTEHQYAVQAPDLAALAAKHPLATLAVRASRIPAAAPAGFRAATRL